MQVLAVAIAATVSCAGTPAEDTNDLAKPDLELKSVVEAYEPGELTDTLDLFRITAIALVGDTIAVADGADRVVLLTRSLGLIGSFGRTGSGPAEFKRPRSVQFWNQGWVVSDGGNSRVTFFNAAGVPIRELAVPSVRGETVVTSTGDVIVAALSDTHYAERISEAGSDPWAARDPVRVVEPGSDRAYPFVRSHICLTAGDTLHVLDEETLEFLKYSPAGTLTMRRKIPEEIRGTLLEGTGARVEEHRPGMTSISYRPPVRGMACGNDGRIWIPVSAPDAFPDVFALVANPTTYAVQLVRADITAEESRPSIVVAADESNLVTAETFGGAVKVWAFGERNR